MEGNVYPEQTWIASEKFPASETIHRAITAIFVYMRETNPIKLYIREWAKEADKRQCDLVKETGLSKGYVSQLWSGRKRAGPSALMRVANALDVPPWALYEPPTSIQARTVVAMARVPKEKQETALEMLIGLGERKRAAA